MFPVITLTFVTFEMDKKISLPDLSATRNKMPVPKFTWLAWAAENEIQMCWCCESTLREVHIPVSTDWVF